MWLYLPSLTSPGSPAPEVSILPSDAFFRLLSASAMWRGKSRPWKFWRREWRKGRLTTLRSGRTSEPFPLPATEEFPWWCSEQSGLNIDCARDVFFSGAHALVALLEYSRDVLGDGSESQQQFLGDLFRELKAHGDTMRQKAETVIPQAGKTVQ